MARSNSSDSHIANAQKFVTQGRFQEAIVEYTKAIKIEDKPFTHVLRAATYGVLLGTQMEYFDQKTPIAKAAIPDFDLCINIFKKSGDIPGFPFGLKDFYFQRATAYVYLGNPKKAIEDINDAILIDPQDAEFWKQKGGIYLDQLNDPSNASGCFKTAISIQPSADAYLFLAWAHIDMKDVEHAMMFIHIAAGMDMDVLDMERNDGSFKEHQWKLIRSSYLPYANR